MDEVNKVGVEFFGENQPNAFASLESLGFMDMPNWKEWDCCKGDEQVSKFPRLSKLSVSGCPQLLGRSLVQWGFDRLSSLQSLTICGEGCSDVVSFPEEDMMLPPSLTHIDIRNFENLEYMLSNGFQNLTSLQILIIYNCSKLTALPEKDMLLSLERLYIYNCPLLKEECKRGRGREWSNIAHIPSVHIDEHFIIPKN
ncbi:hypothetical protein REPUB_Repub11eG0035700 [Reevesia pubescens]